MDNLSENSTKCVADSSTYYFSLVFDIGGTLSKSFYAHWLSHKPVTQAQIATRRENHSALNTW